MFRDKTKLILEEVIVEDSSATLLDLPEDLFYRIFCLLDLKSLTASSMANKYANALFKDEKIQTRFNMYQDFHPSQITIPRHTFERFYLYRQAKKERQTIERAWLWGDADQREKYATNANVTTILFILICFVLALYFVSRKIVAFTGGHYEFLFEDKVGLAVFGVSIAGLLSSNHVADYVRANGRYHEELKRIIKVLEARDRVVTLPISEAGCLFNLQRR